MGGRVSPELEREVTPEKVRVAARRIWEDLRDETTAGDREGATEDLSLILAYTLRAELANDKLLRLAALHPDIMWTTAPRAPSEDVTERCTCVQFCGINDDCPIHGASQAAPLSETPISETDVNRATSLLVDAVGQGPSYQQVEKMLTEFLAARRATGGQT